MYAHKSITIHIIIHCRVSTPKTIEFRSKLGFNQYDITLTKEQSVLKSIMNVSEGEHMRTQCRILGYRIDLYFHEKGHKDRNINDEIQGQKALETNLVVDLLGLILMKKNLIFLRLGKKDLDTSKNQLKYQLRNL